MASLTGTSGVLLTFDDFVAGVENFGRHIQPKIHMQPKMKCRAHIKSA